jgi:hypothetical protein
MEEKKTDNVQANNKESHLNVNRLLYNKETGFTYSLMIIKSQQRV